MGGGELSRRFGLPFWSFTLTATDANRWAIRLARQVTGRPKILVNSWCYHGSVDETLIVVGPTGRPRYVTATSARRRRAGHLPGRRVQRPRGSRARAVARRCRRVLMEPALTNIGIVLPEPGYLDGVRA